MRLPEYKAKKPELKRAVLYLRVSTEEQVTNYSLGTQEEICRREASHRGYEIIEVFKEEGKSAKNMKTTYNIVVDNRRERSFSS